jgi:toxin YoeB
MMHKTWHDTAWEDYCYWQTQDKKTLRRINDLIKDIDRNGNDGIGKPEPLKNRAGYWSRRISEKDRLIYKIEDGKITIAQCRNHYNDH